MLGLEGLIRLPIGFWMVGRSLFRAFCCYFGKGNKKQNTEARIIPKSTISSFSQSFILPNDGVWVEFRQPQKTPSLSGLVLDSSKVKQNKQTSNYPLILRLLGFQIAPHVVRRYIIPGDPYRSPNIPWQPKFSGCAESSTSSNTFDIQGLI